MNRRHMLVALLWLSSAGSLASHAHGQAWENQTVESATAVLQEIMATPASQIPKSLLKDAQGIAIIPNSVKGGFVVGLRLGRGVVALRDATGAWQPPIFVSLSGGSLGWQAGLQTTDVILVFKTRKSVDGLLRGKLTLGVDAAAAAGPVGREAAASTDLALGAEIYSYSRSRGLFAGVSVAGSSLQIDNPAGLAYYGRPGIIPAAGQQVASTALLPPSAVRLMSVLSQYTGAAEVPAGQMAVPVAQFGSAVLAPPPTAEATRQQLTDAARRLYDLLDDTWKQYLAIPRQVFVPDKPADPEALAQTLRRFDSVLADARYAELTRRPEFTAAHRLLREYVTLFAGKDGKRLALPAPPVEAGGSTNAAQPR